MFTPDEVEDLAQAHALARAGVPEQELPTIVRATGSTILDVVKATVLGEIPAVWMRGP